MNFWKIMGGAAIGVGVMVAAPVLAPAGAITVIGAALGAGMGATVVSSGQAVNACLDNMKEEARIDGFQQGKAENYMEIQKMKQMLEVAKERLSEQKQYEEFLMAVFAVGVSVAHCDGEFDPQERLDIEEFIAGVAFNALPEGVQRILQVFYSNPPSFSDAMEYIDKVGKENWEIFDEVIEMISLSDGLIKDQERAFLEQWHLHKAS